MGYKLNAFIANVMKQSLSVSFLFISIFVFGQADINQHQVDSMMNAWKKRVLDKPLPVFIAAGDNGVVSNDSLKGKITFINMWESHCAPCMAEMGVLNKLYDTLSNNSKFQFISITSDNMETINQIKEKYHIQYPVYHLDEDGCYQLNEGMGYPTYIVLNEKALVKYISAGGYTDNLKIRHFILATDIFPAILKELR